MPLFIPPPGIPCCDNCDANLFQVETISLKTLYPTQAGQSTKPSEQLKNSLKVALQTWCFAIIECDYPLLDTQ